MMSELAIRQTSLTRVVRQLVASGVLTESRAHVLGLNRRVKVYRLTILGFTLARYLVSKRVREDPASSDRAGESSPGARPTTPSTPEPVAHPGDVRDSPAR